MWRLGIHFYDYTHALSRMSQFKRAVLKIAQENPKFRRQLRLVAQEHKPGDVWKTDSGYRGMSSNGEAKSFKTREEAQSYAKGKSGLKGKLQALKEKFGKKGAEVAKFVTDKGFRKESVNAFKERAADVKAKMGQELKESKEMLGTLRKLVTKQEVSKEEKQQALKQAMDVVKIVVVGGASVSPIPGATPMLLGSAKVISKMFKTDFSWFPSSFRQASEETGPEALAESFTDNLMQGLSQLSEEDLQDIVEKIS